MNDKIIKRVLDETEYMLKTNETIREVAEVFNVSKSTVHVDLTKRLFLLDLDLYNNIGDILKKHLEIRHINGGIATKNKYLVK